jgi:uncharacterized protein YyaL (SSP411 family)
MSILTFMIFPPIFEIVRRQLPRDPESCSMTENLLAHETSPYLLQHSTNPVHWRPWGVEALGEAQRLARPILLSVGYAACHWCHVMAHESFEDPATAAVMNKLFVNIKVDREERPDLDIIYQHALALMGEQGGWPLTMFCTPKGEPFWGGTYFPSTPRYGRPAFQDILRRVAEVYHKDQDVVVRNVEALQHGLAHLGQSTAARQVSSDLILHAATRLASHVDLRDGGIGPAPKFPQAPLFSLFWRLWIRTRQPKFRDAVLLTLTRMSQGGIYDHLGGGFARYSTDSHWLVPHFEKMLYDNAQLLELLSDVWLDTQNPLFKARISETVGWLLREMLTDDGGFAATQDADSEGHEGRFYVWSAAELDTLLGKDAIFFKSVYGVTDEGNWEGSNILNRTPNDTLDDPDTESRLSRCRRILLIAREQRPKPARDDKVLADWNGLMVAALTQAALALREASWLAVAQRAYEFVRSHMSDNGRLYHSFRNRTPKHAGCLEDYAAMMRAAIALHEATADRQYLSHAESWAETLDRHFWDPLDGGYFTTADDVRDVIVRTKLASDNATPAGNGMAAMTIARLYYLTGRDTYRDRAESTIAAFSGQLQQNAFSLATLLSAADFLEHAVQLVVIGDPRDPDLQAFHQAARAISQPNRVTLARQHTTGLPPTHPAAGKLQVDGKPTAYVCTGQTCSLPITSPSALTLALAPLAGTRHADPHL